MSDRDKVESFLEKHKPLSPNEVYGKLREAEDTRRKMTTDIEEIERNLTSFLETEDPMIDPGTGKVVAWLRHLPYSEYMSMVPEELWEAKDDPETLLSQAEKQSDIIFMWMERMISKPSWTAEVWKEKATVRFIELFNARIEEIFSQLNEKVDFF